MEQFITTLPNTFLGWISTIIVILSGVVVVFNKIRNDDLKTLRDSNKDLRDAHDDNNKKIEELEKSLKLLAEKVLVLESEKKTIQDLVVLALEAYFENNPSEALKTKTKIKTEITTKVS